MALSKVVIRVDAIPAVGTRISIVDDSYASFSFDFQPTRLTIGQIDIVPTPTISQLVYDIYRYFGIDYNVLGRYQVNFDTALSTITIIAKDENSTFTESFNDTAGDIVSVIDNGTPVPKFTINTVTALEATVGDPSTTVKLSATTSDIAESISSPYAGLVTANPHIFETVRANKITLTMLYNGLTASKIVSVPLLLTSYFTVDSIVTPSGSTVTINRIYPLARNQDGLLLTFEYKLDTYEWGVSNSWSGIAVGSHTIYIRDNIGAEISIPVVIETFSPNLVDYEPVIEISNANALRFKLNEVWDTNGISKNVENTLSHEEDSKFNLRRYLQPFQKNDIVNAQIKTNYTNLTAKIVDLAGNETALTIIQTTDNMNKQDVRDGKIKILNDGTIGVYFGSGNTYDPDTLAQNGSYNNYEYLMDWINVDDYINIEGIGWGKISAIYSPTSDFEFYYVSVNLTNTLNYTEGTTVKISTVYNIADYNRFEFSLDLSTREGVYYVVVNASDSEYGAKEYVSEWIDVQEIHENHHIIKYYSTKNNEINYGTGVTFTIRVPYLVKLKWSPSSEQEIYVTDTKTINLDSKVREFYKLSLMPLPTAMAQKMVLILAHNRIFVDGVSYLLEGDIESKALGVSNLYQISANLVKTNYVFTSARGITASEILLDSGIPLAIDENSASLLFIE